MICVLCFLNIVPKIDELVRELESVTNWFLLGLSLGVSEGQLHELETQQSSVEYIRVQLLSEWIRRDSEATWLKVVTALRKMGELKLARNVAAKHGLFRLSCS